MVTIKKYNLDGKSVGHIDVEDALANAEANSQMIKDYIVALRANARQWSASTKTRSEVAHTTKKPHAQKGGGRARQGSLVSPQYRGGGRVFAPRPKFDQHIRRNKKERKAAIRSLIAEKIKEEKIHIIQDIHLDTPKTKTIAHFIKSLGMKGRILFLGESLFEDIKTTEGKIQVAVHSDKHENLRKSLRNLPKVDFMLATNVSGYDVLVAHEIVLTKAAFNELTHWLQ